MMFSFLCFLAGISIAYTFCSFSANKEIANLEKENLRLKTLPQAISTAELAAEFRSFVEGVEGKVSPEMDSFLQRVTSNPAPPRNPNNDLWGAFWDEFSKVETDFYRVEVLETWSNQILFPLGRYGKIWQQFRTDFYRAEASEILKDNREMMGD